MIQNHVTTQKTSQRLAELMGEHAPDSAFWWCHMDTQDGEGQYEMVLNPNNQRKNRGRNGKRIQYFCF